MPRLFLAIDPPDRVKDAVADLQEDLSQARWVDIDNLHLTLRFIGEVSDAVTREVIDSVARIAAPSVAVQPEGPGHFERRGRPTVLWVGVAASAELLALHRAAEAACRAAGLPPDPRRFHPHITIARFGAGITAEAVGRWLERRPPPRLDPFTATEVTLFRSDLRPDGPRYDPLLRVPLEHLPDADSTGWTES